jgi:hypothetical protein
MLAPMDPAAASAGPWLVLGAVLGLLLAGTAVLATTSVRRRARSSDSRAAEPATNPPRDEPGGWTEDDLPAFLDQPPGVAPDGTAHKRGSTADDPPLATPEPEPPARRRVASHAASAASSAADPGRLLLVLATVAVLLIGLAAALAALSSGDRSTRHPVAQRPAAPTWEVPDLTPLPDRPEPGDPGAGRLAAASVPIGADGALARLAFEGLVLERRAVGVTVAYPGVSVTAAEVPGGPALAHVRLPVWNCLTDTAPDDPVAAGCRRLPTEYADLATPALTVTGDGDGLRLSGRFATYVRPGGSPPAWTGRVYPFTAHVAPHGRGATGTLHLGTERAAAVDDPPLSDFRRGG